MTEETKFTTCAELDIYDLSLSDREASFIIYQFNKMLKTPPERINWGETFYFNKLHEKIDSCNFAHITFKYNKKTFYSTYKVTCNTTMDSSVTESVNKYYKLLGLELTVDTCCDRMSIHIYFPKE